jgi:hypothetical protein
MEIIINNKTYTIDFSTGKLEIMWADETTGLKKVAVMEEVSIGAAHSKRIQTKMYIYDITPTGQRINRKEQKYATSEADFDFFEQSALGAAIKMFVLNGMIRKLGFAWAIFNSSGEQVTILEEPAIEEEGGEGE